MAFSTGSSRLRSGAAPRQSGGVVVGDRFARKGLEGDKNGLVRPRREGSEGTGKGPVEGLSADGNQTAGLRAEDVIPVAGPGSLAAATRDCPGKGAHDGGEGES